MRRIVIIAAAILGTLIVLALAAPFFIDVERFKPRILAAISEGLGRPVAVDGDLSLSLLPRPRLSVAGLSIANAVGFADQPMVRVERLDVEIALMPLLSGDLDVKRLVLRRPDILLEQAAGGGNNWTLAADTPAAADAAPEQASPGIKIGRLRLIDGRIVYHDHVSDSRRIIEGFDAGLSMDSLQGPFDLEARFSLDAMPINLKAVIGAMNGGPAAIAAEGALGDAALTWRFDGDADFAAGAVTGAFEASADDLAQLGTLLSGDDAAPSPLPARAMALKGRVTVGEQGVRLSDLLFRLGESVVTGLVTIEDGNPRVIAAEFDSARLDVADFSTAPASTEPLTGPFALTLPGDMSATLSLNIASVDGAGVPLSNARLVARLDDAALHIDRLQAQLPGGDVAANGVLTSNDGLAAFTGAISANMPDLRALFQALAVETAALPAQAYRKAALQGDLHLAGDQLALKNLSGRLDDSTVSGSLGYHLRARPAYAAAVVLDRLDLDRYAPAAQAGETPAAAKAEPMSLAALAEFDAELAITLNSLIRGGADLGGMTVKASLLQGVLRLNQARLGSPDRVMVGITGTLRDLAAAESKLDLNLEAAGAGLDRAFTALALPVPESLQNTGAFRLAGTAAGTLTGVTLDLGGNVGDLAASLKGRLDDWASAAPRFDVKVEAQHRNLASLARQFNLADLPAGDKAAPVRLDATFSGAGAGDITAAGQILAGADQIAFTLDRRAGAVKASLNARAKEMRAFIQTLGIDYQPAAGDVGALDLAIAVSGDEDALTIDTLRASMGNMALSGTGRLMLAGAVPDVDLTLSAGALDLDRLLPPAETGAEQAADGGARWSDEPLALDWVKAVDGKLSLSAESLALRGYRFDTLRLALESRGAVLNVSDLSGRLFGGPATIRASLDVTALPRLSMTLDMTDVPVADLLQAAASIQPMTGTMMLNGQFSGQGGSEQAIVASLRGEGHVGAQNGVIHRIDLARVNERLESLGTINDFIRLTGTALKGGETAYRHLGFDIVANQGKLNSRNFTADVDGADIGFTLRSDLPAWTIDAAAQIKLQSNAAAPPIGATIVGDLDSPVISYQTKALEQWVSARLGAAVVKGIVSGEGVGLKDLLQKKPPPQPEASAPTAGDTSTGTDTSNQLNGETPAPAPTAPPPAKKPEEEIRDLLLKGLFGKKKTAPAPE